MPVDVQNLKNRYLALRSDRAANEEPVWDEIEKFIMPLTGTTAQALQGSTVDQKTAIQLWDLTAPLANEHLASSLHGDVTSPASKWLDLEWQDPEAEKDHEAVKHREDCANQVWNELQASDFNMEIASGYLEFSGLGNMCLVCEPTSTVPGQWKGLDFTAVPVRQVQFEEDSKGSVLRWYRHLRWTAVQIVDHCEREKDEKGNPKYPAPEKYRQMAGRAEDVSTKVDVIFCIFRRQDLPEDVEGLVREELRPYGSVYFTLEEGERLGEEGGFYKMPAVMARWGKRPGTQWGFGRGHTALRSVKWVNGFKELQRAAAEKTVDPALGVTERVSTIDLRAGKASVAPSKEDIWPIESAARFDVSAEVMQDERIEIRRCFHEDDLQLKESPQMTATEVQARKDQMNRALGSPVGRLQTDALGPIVLVVLDLLQRAGRLPPPPEVVRRKKSEVKLRFRGPVARAQVMDEVVAIEREAGFVSNLLQMGFTDARHYFDLGAAIREHAKRLGVPASVMVSPEEAKRAVEAEQRAMAMAQAAETAKAQGQALQAAAGAASTVSAAGIGAQPALVPTAGVVS